jgi:hypothetical protein
MSDTNLNDDEIPQDGVNVMMTRLIRRSATTTTATPYSTQSLCYVHIHPIHGFMQYSP